MTEVKRLSKIAKELNVGIHTIVEFLSAKGFEIESSPNTKVTSTLYDILLKEYQAEKYLKEKSQQIEIDKSKKKSLSIDDDEDDDEDDDVVEPKKHHHVTPEHHVDEIQIKTSLNIIGKIDIDKPKVKAKVEAIPEPKQEVKPEPIPEPVVPTIIEAPVVEVPTPKPVEKPKSAPIVETPVVEEIVVKEEKLEPEHIESKREQLKDVTVIGKIDLNALNTKTRPAKKSKEEKDKERQDKYTRENTQRESRRSEIADASDNTPDAVEKSTTPDHIKTDFEKLSGPTILGKIDLKDAKREPAYGSEEYKRKRKRIKKKLSEKAVEENPTPGATGVVTTPAASVAPTGERRFIPKLKDKRKSTTTTGGIKAEPTNEDVQKQIKETLARLSQPKGKSKSVKYRRQKRDAVNQQMQSNLDRQEGEKLILKVTEFVTANELATLMEVQVTEVISSCMALGLFVSINQRLDAETMSIVAEEFGYKVEFIKVEEQDDELEIEENPEDLAPRPPIVTVMGHVDHGKTKLLDYIRNTNVVAGEAGGITQHIGAYNVQLENGKHITFLDTPGHEAFTAMRARGAKVTDVAIIVIAADDSVMPQTIEAINHAQAANVPLIFAFNKIDKPGTNADKIREQLAAMNLLVEDWGGKYQCQEISAKTGLNIDLLLEKVLLESELLELTANADKFAKGTVLESTLDKGRGYVSTVLVESGTLKIGDVVLAGSYFGKVKAMHNERGVSVKEAGPSMPVTILGIGGSPQAGDNFKALGTEKEAKEIAFKRQQLLREQNLRTQKHITLDEIGRRIAIGNFQELKIIVKGDVDGSIEALTDSLLKLSTEQVAINVIHKSVGAITESDVLLASASDAIIVGFQVRPSLNARRLAEREQVDVRLYSIIYDAIEQIKEAMEGMLSPEIEEKIITNIEVREVFKITKFGTVAGCMVLDGKVTRNTKIRVIRDGIVVHSGELSSLKRFKEDAKEVLTGFECGLSINNYNDIREKDIIEGYEQVEVKKKL